MKFSNILILASALPALAVPDAGEPAVAGLAPASFGSPSGAPAVVVDGQTGGSSTPIKRESNLDQSIQELFKYVKQKYPELHLANNEENGHAKRGLPFWIIFQIVRCLTGILGSSANVDLNNEKVNGMVTEIAEKVSQILGETGDHTN